MGRLHPNSPALRTETGFHVWISLWFADYLRILWEGCFRWTCGSQPMISCFQCFLSKSKAWVTESVSRHSVRDFLLFHIFRVAYRSSSIVHQLLFRPLDLYPVWTRPLAPPLQTAPLVSRHRWSMSTSLRFRYISGLRLTVTTKVYVAYELLQRIAHRLFRSIVINVVLPFKLQTLGLDRRPTTSFRFPGDCVSGSHIRISVSILLLTSLWFGAVRSSKVEQVRLHGDLLLGGLFPMHEVGQPPDRPCGPIKEEKGIQRMEAMLYALDRINADYRILPNLTLGALILDTCSSDTHALEQSMEFVKASLTSLEDSEYRCEDGRRPLYTPRRPVVGVVGASSSSVSVMVANILRLFKIPQVSYASTSVELSDKARFGYFSRVVPPDNFQGQALVDVVQRLGWNYVSTVAVEGDYGEKGIETFKSRAERAGICIAVSEKISRNSKAEDFDNIISSLASKPQARAVVLFVDEDNCRKLLAASARASRAGHFLWLGSDSWGAKSHPVRDQETVARSAITILPKRHNIPGFDDYFLALHPSSNTRNVWYKPFWKQHFNCTFRNGTRKTKCTGHERLIKYEQEGLVPFVVDAVYAVAHALHKLLEDHCGSASNFCSAIRPIPHGELLLKYIRNVSFPSPQGGGLWVRFNADGDAPGSYRIYQYQEIKQGQFEYHVIGEWSERLSLNVSLLQWPDELNESSSDGTSRHAPASVCSLPCPLGYSRAFQSQRCCWLCVPCREEEYITNDTCIPCLPGFLPNDMKNSCEKMPVEYMTWDSPWAIVPASLASVGIAATLGTVSIFVRYNGTPIIMASGRELCYVLLVGLLLCYSISFVILAKPARVTCAVLRVGVGICLSICYSAVFTKTNRISRIFNRGIRSTKRPSYTSPKSQVVICLGLVSVQLVFTVTWLVVEPPGVREVYPTRSSAVLQCGISSVSLMMSLLYNMLLILLCTTYAFKTRKIPENFNEAKYIGFTMYSTCIVWLAFVPIYFGTNNDYKIQIASLCTCISISASVVLGCLFLPKVYIVVYQPYKNVRPGSQGTASFQPGSGVMRFARPHSSAAALASVATAAVIGASPGPRPAAILAVAAAGTVEGSSVSRDEEDSPRPCRTNGELTSPSVEESSLS